MISIFSEAGAGTFTKIMSCVFTKTNFLAVSGRKCVFRIIIQPFLSSHPMVYRIIKHTRDMQFFEEPLFQSAFNLLFAVSINLSAHFEAALDWLCRPDKR